MYELKSSGETWSIFLPIVPGSKQQSEELTVSFSVEEQEALQEEMLWQRLRAEAIDVQD